MKKLQIHCIQHVPFEGLGYIEEWIIMNGHNLSYTKTYESDKFPELKSIDWLVVMGGPMNINNEKEYPWLKEEKKIIKSAIDADKVVLGICLGAQLIASTLDAKIYSNLEKEIGWFPLSRTKEGAKSSLLKNFPEDLKVLHWHEDTFELPKKATLLLESVACKNQAFIYNKKVLGLQFHLESTPTTLKKMILHCNDELVDGKYIQKKGELLNNHITLCNQTNIFLESLLNNLIIQIT